MRKVKLSDICDISSGGTPSRNNPEYFKGDIPWAKISDIENSDNGVVFETEEHISAEGLKNIRGKLFPKGTLLFAMYGSIGKVGITGRALSTNQAILGIRPRRDDEVNLNYLKTWFASNKQKLINQGRGVALKNLSATIVRDLEIELPPLDDQIRIADLLGKVEGLIAQRKQHLKQLDDLLKSVFLEMFGDPVGNEKGWEPGTSSTYAEMVTVGVVVKPASHYVENGVVALRSLNIKPNRLDLNDLVYFSQNSNDGILSKSRLKTDDIVIVRTGKTGTAAVVPASLEGANCIDLIIVRPKHEKIHPLYLTCLLNSERGMALVASLEVGGIQKHFNVGALNKIPFPLPPIDFQNKFAAIVEKVESLKSHYQQSLTDLENLYGALSQQAFKAELDLSRVPLSLDNNQSQ